MTKRFKVVDDATGRAQLATAAQAAAEVKPELNFVTSEIGNDSQVNGADLSEALLSAAGAGSYAQDGGRSIEIGIAAMGTGFSGPYQLTRFFSVISSVVVGVDEDVQLQTLTEVASPTTTLEMVVLNRTLFPVYVWSQDGSNFDTIPAGQIRRYLAIPSAGSVEWITL